jgi:hypothetical protein
VVLHLALVQDAWYSEGGGEGRGGAYFLERHVELFSQIEL